jgi:murein DD-endopeptidase MepM/ murein hydrolase activator NlpD
VVAAAAGRIVAIQDRYSERQSGRAAALCHNNYVWIAHANGEWTNYSHLAQGSVTRKAGLKVGDVVKAGQYIGDEGAVGCAMLKHVTLKLRWLIPISLSIRVGSSRTMTVASVNTIRDSVISQTRLR